MNTEITLDSIIKKSKLKCDEIEVIKKAYNYAVKKHRGMKRLTGDDYISHPLNVAYIVSNLNVDYITIASSLIHEVVNNSIEETEISEIEELFGSEISNIVDAISKINKLELVDDKENSAIYLRKVLVGLATDVRVLYIKLADRLHNLRTLYPLPKEKQRQKINETINVLIPIAHRLGINSIKNELEDLSLKYSKPDVYNDILEKLNATKDELSSVLQEMQESISEILYDHNIKFEIKSRVKSVYSIYNKLATGRPWSDIYDILALRVFVNQESDCYLVVGLIHSKFRPIPKRFKDYIANPKENMYQSLHTSVFGIDGHLFEIQVRTYEMDEIAEKGIASHWSYKEKGTKKIQNIMEQKLEMFRSIIEDNKSEDNDVIFAQNINKELLSEMIYVFTPKGDVVELPSGSTPIDFAYRIHSTVGDTLVGALVNDKIVPLTEVLENNDIVKINTNQSSTPKKEWLNIVKTNQAKNKIKAFFSKKEKEIYIEKGKNILEKEIRKQKLVISEVLNAENETKILKDLKLKNIEDLYFNIGNLRYTPNYIINLTKDKKENVTDALLEKISKHSEIKDINNDILVDGKSDILVNTAKCCNPIKGDDIIGFITKGEGICVHKKNCINVNQTSERLINVEWNNLITSTYHKNITINTLEDRNYLVDIINFATTKNITVNGITALNKTIYKLKVEVHNIEELNNFIYGLDSIKFVLKVEVE